MAEVAPSGLTLDGHVFVHAVTPGAFVAALGPANRVIDAGGPAPHGHRSTLLHVYDSLGLLINEHHHTGTICEVRFSLWPEQDIHPPAAAFPGELRLGIRSIRSGAMEAELKACGLPFEPSLAGDWGVTGGPVSIWATTRGARLKSGRRSRVRRIVHVSVGLRHDPWDERRAAAPRAR